MRRMILAVVAFILVVHLHGRAASEALAIESEPAGASVYIDGRFAGLTPLNVARLSNGDHRVRLVKDGYLDNGRLVTIGKERPRLVRVTLTRGALNGGGSEQVISGGGGGGSKKWIWIGAAAAGAAAGAFVATHRNGPPSVARVLVAPEVALAGVTNVSFTATATDPDGDSLSYSWNFGDGSTGSGQTTTHTYNSAGSFNAVVTVSDAKASASGSGTANVRNINGTWNGNLGSNQTVFFTMVFSQATNSFVGTYSDTVSGSGSVSGGRLGPTLDLAFTVQIPGFNAVNFTGAIDASLNRMTGNAVQYAGGPNTFYLNRR